MARGKREHPEVTSMIEKLAALRINESFFIPSTTRKECEFIRQPAKRKGIKLRLEEVKCDQIYQMPGVRIFRKEGAFDQL